MIYYSLFFLCVVFSIIEIYCNNNSITLKNNKLYFVLIVCMILLAGLRDCSVGLDTSEYYRIFRVIHNNPDTVIHSLKNYNVEIGYAILNLISPTFSSLLFLCVTISVVIFALIIEKLEVTNKCAVLLFYYSTVFLYYDMGIMREGIAISIVFWGILCLSMNKKKTFLFCVSIAMFFHVTACLALPLLFLGNREFSRRLYYLLIIALAVLFSFSDIIGIIQFIERQINISYVTRKMSLFYSQQTDGGIGLFSFLRRYLLLFLFVEMLLKKRIVIGGKKIVTVRSDERINMTYLNAYWVSLIEFTFFSSAITILASRGTAYLYFCEILIFEKLISGKKKHLLNYGLFIAFSVLSFLSLYGTIHGTVGDRYLPYITYGE